MGMQSLKPDAEREKRLITKMQSLGPSAERGMQMASKMKSLKLGAERGKQIMCHACIAQCGSRVHCMWPRVHCTTKNQLYQGVQAQQESIHMWTSAPCTTK